jgi:hypothetical protein
MIYSVGDMVVVRVNGIHQVGTVSLRRKLKRGWVYSVELENGKHLEECSVNKELSHCHIIRGLTKSLSNGN